MSDDDDPFLGTEQAAIHRKVHRSTIDRWVKRGILKPVMVNGKRHFSKAMLRAAKDPPKVKLAIDAGRKVTPGWEHVTVEEFDAATAEAMRIKRGEIDP